VARRGHVLAFLALVVFPVDAVDAGRRGVGVGRDYVRGFSAERQQHLGRGVSTKYAYSVAHRYKRFAKLTVLKKLKRRIPKGPQPAPREIYAHRVVSVVEALRADPAFQARFGPVVVETVSPAPGVLLQAPAHGIRYRELSQAARNVAAIEIAAAADALENMFPRFRASRHPGNFRFERSGHIRAWFDLFSDTKAQPPLDAVLP